MKKLLRNISETLADAALLEMGVNEAVFPSIADIEAETREENLIEVAFADAADYEDIHNAIVREHRRIMGVIRPDECEYDDNGVCFV